MKKKSKQPHIIHLDKIGKKNTGYISFVENLSQIPFKIKRIFWVYRTPRSITKRGRHAHKTLQQVLFAVHGRVKVELNSAGGKKRKFILSDPSHGLYMPPMHWGKITFYGNTAILLCLASKKYDENDYIRNYKEFKRLGKK